MKSRNIICSDNFSFQNNGIKKCTCWKTFGFYGKTVGFFGKQCLKKCFDTTSHMIYFDYKAYAFYQNKTIHVLHKLSFHNKIPHRSHSRIGHVIQEP